MNETVAQFCDAIRSVGLQPPDQIIRGTLHRFPGMGKKPGNDAGWCLLFQDERGGCFGDWSAGLSETWQAKRRAFYSPAERAAFARRLRSAKAEAAAAQESRQTEAATRAVALWHAASAALDGHPYLIRKAIQPRGARLHQGALVVPITDFEDALTSLQFISAKGAKRLLSGGRKQGCFIHVAGNIGKPARIIICEGWATGCTLAADVPDALVLAAIDAGNLEPVALAARYRWPHAELVIAGDDDRLTSGNPGATKARHAAISANALLALPQWPASAPERLTDFNDLAVWLAGGAK